MGGVQATTPLDPRVLDAMLPFMTEQYGNPHSRTHMYGWESEDAGEVARKQVTVCGCSLRHHLTVGCLIKRSYSGVVLHQGWPTSPWILVH